MKQYISSKEFHQHSCSSESFNDRNTWETRLYSFWYHPRSQILFEFSVEEKRKSHTEKGLVFKLLHLHNPMFRKKKEPFIKNIENEHWFVCILSRRLDFITLLSKLLNCAHIVIQFSNCKKFKDSHVTFWLLVVDTQKESILVMTPNCKWSLESTSGVVRSVKYCFIAISPRFTSIQVIVPVRIPF